MASGVRIGMLGELDVRTCEGAAVAVPGSRLRGLLVRLALADGRPVPSELLIGELWSDADRPAGAVNALQVLVSRLRRTLPEGLVESRPRAYRLAVPPDALDVREFEELAARGRSLLGTDDVRAAAALRAALALWRGPALADLDDTGFVRVQRDRLAELRLAVTEDRFEAELSGGDGAGLVPDLEALVAAHPLRERPRAQLMRALSAAGRQADALAAYEESRRLLADELGVDPGPELAGAHLAVLRGEAAPAVRGPRTPKSTESTESPETRVPPERPSPRPRTNLRAQFTPFVGREQEVADIERLVRTRRLLTLVGPGGAGKTRLAAECAARLAEAVPDGAWLVELAAVADPSDVPQAVVTALGLREGGLMTPAVTSPQGPRDRLVAALRDKRTLLVLDNCEQVVDAVAVLVDALLGQCPQVRVLTTSREPLGITGEQLVPVLPMPVPDPGTPVGLAVRSPAVRLFAERAAAARPSFRVAEDNVGVVLDICRALDGLPLALELAATRLRSMSPRQVRDRLDDRFALLTAGSRTALPRQQTLHAVVDWSWELLTATERELAAAFAVFRSGAVLRTVERVTADDPGARRPTVLGQDVVDALTGLVDKSFLTVTDTEGEPRYRMLETVRAFALAKLDTTGRGERVRHRHAEFFLDLAERAEPQLRRGDQLDWLRALTAEHDELMAALSWAVDRGESCLATRLVAALGWYWFLRGRRQEAAQWAGRALALGQAEVPPAARVLALVTAVPQPDGAGPAPDDFRSRMAEARVLIDGMERDGHPFSHPALGLFEPIASMLSGDGSLLESLARRSEDPDPWVRGLARLHRGRIAMTLGEPERAAADYRVAAGLFRGIGERWGTAQALVAAAETPGMRGERGAAVGALEEALHLVAELGDREDQALLMVRLATERARAGDLERARSELADALHLADELGAREQRALALWATGEVARRAGVPEEARPWLEQALAEFAAPGRFGDRVHALVLASLGFVEAAAERGTAARERFAEAVAALPPVPDPGVLACLLELLAETELAAGRPERAAALLGSAGALPGADDGLARPDADRVSAAVRRQLSGAEYATAYARGAATRRDAAIALLRETAGRT
ncbi:BTAD domain-containing putative transcriptional regulator [Streptomyces sp. TRM68416]|uniref:BTAD domain-containing putative transcriptional regulator n=1 Tax=Streptomyces sp. TRM68416 TaxID=2758412 RepID=UPI001661B4C3|nr:BTAD domain-containing putative transcriptional regulator [Streptomyces sp. TRM68416]MBD0842326.1 AfsR/SARP family transcriptional regulator [Streptomyces sp. TRM68416]